MAVLTSVFVGSIISAMLYGVTCGQACHYLRIYPKDGARMKGMMCLMGHYMWFLFIRKCDGKSPLDTNMWFLTGVIHMEPSFHTIRGLSDCQQIVIFMVQCFYIRKIWNCKIRFAYTLSLDHPVSVTVDAVFKYFEPSLGDIQSQDGRKAKVGAELPIAYVVTSLLGQILLLVALIMNIVIDVGITGSMCQVMLQHKASSLSNSRSVVKGIIQWAVATGLTVTCWIHTGNLCSVAAITLMVEALVLAKNDFVPAGLYLIGAKLYANSMLASSSVLQTQWPSIN
ncbi:hypothetical protein GLOTRDRAFT_95218 [Gloeophyllum trabeum ATCC 11539]|uniref:DUF6534 domain-containing protein n=1 Tax=Gloeophyllum trabeum (strain ATCC 11539 / FP-39264 / Madison 617) TaxID=670483 RepID=S7PZW2_GLOTA|nr:uncharacterized protein GLOTRDRAFT_95218 [Gloeophyllum trabeum ATCC 11539]EPQ53216.1 hypothetical protein GLOTRDRAFT_95218 [Gloeophyllum trabeum ATCC 11539]